MRSIRQIAVALLLSIAPAFPTAGAEPLRKERIGQLRAPSCDAIASSAQSFPQEKVRKTTGYYTPLFPAGPDGHLRTEDRRACLTVEGACIVGDYLYNAQTRKPFRRDAVPFRFGMGAGGGNYNRTNALDPCRTFAADVHAYPVGTVIYMPYMRGRICPQSGEPVDGCFVVADRGSAIQGRRRFDMFSGECLHYRKDLSYCTDAGNDHFVAPPGTHYRVVDRDHALAHSLRAEADDFIRRKWTSP